MWVCKLWLWIYKSVCDCMRCRYIRVWMCAYGVKDVGILGCVCRVRVRRYIKIV